MPPYRRRSLLTPEQLGDGLTALVESAVELHEVHMPDAVARLRMGAHPVLWLDVAATAEERCWALLDVLTALAFGLEACSHAEPVRRLRSVS